MAEINDPEAIAFVNNYIRPIAETLRDLDAVTRDAAAIWTDNDMQAHFTNGPDTVEDGRGAEGVSRLTAADVNALVSEVSEIVAQFAVAGAMDAIRKPCVRVLNVGG